MKDFGKAGIRETQLSRSWFLTIRNLILGAAGSVAGYYVIQEHEIVLRVLGCMLIVSFPGLLILLFVQGPAGKGPCPVCGNELETSSGSADDMLCLGCGQYIEARKRVLRELPPNTVREEPAFVVPTPWDDLGDVVGKTIAFSAQEYVLDVARTKKEGHRVLEATWPQVCCVCGGGVDHTESIQMDAMLPPKGRLAVRNREVKLIATGIPHCAIHHEGVAFGGETNTGRPTDRPVGGLRFRALSYRNEFWKHNPWRWPGNEPERRDEILARPG